MENKSRLNCLEALVSEITAGVTIEEDTEVTETEETMALDQAEIMIEAQEEIMGINPRDASTATRRDTLPGTAHNVKYFLIDSQKTQRFHSQGQERQGKRQRRWSQKKGTIKKWRPTQKTQEKKLIIPLKVIFGENLIVNWHYCHSILRYFADKCYLIELIE